MPEKKFERGMRRQRELMRQWMWIGIVLIAIVVFFLIIGRSPLSTPDLSEMLAGTSIRSDKPPPGITVLVEQLLMIGLWFLMAVVLAAPYAIYTVRRQMFFDDEQSCRNVEQVLAHALASHPQDLEARFRLWGESLSTKLASIRGSVGHVSEVVNQLSMVVLTSEHTLDRYFMTQAKDIREEEYHKLNFINLAATLGPILGFAGTILGMIVAFSQLGGEMSKEMIGQIAGAIYTALITTFFGLVIKAIAALMRFIIQNQVDRYTTRILTMSSNITKILAHAQVSGEEG